MHSTSANIRLRDYQERGIFDIRAAWRSRGRRVVYVLPTGGGKTVLFAWIARQAAANGKRVLVLVHRHELLLQTCRKLDAAHGCVSPSFTPRYQELLQVGMVQTVSKRIGNPMFPKFDLIVVDECHHTMAASYRAILDANPQAHVLGVTATPVRQDGKGLGDFFDWMVLGPTVEELTQLGHLAPAVLYAPTTIDTSGIGKVAGDFNKKDLSARSDTTFITGDAVKHYRKLADGKRALVATVSVEHAHHVAQRFNEAGYRFKAVFGDMEQRERDDAIRGLESLEYHGLVYCDLFSEGVDVPVVECGIFLRPTHSIGLWDQQVGRILRPCSGKEHAILLDHAGNAMRHGIAAWGRDWSLDTSTKKKKRDEEKKLLVKTCPACFGVHRPAPACPYCGHEYKVAGRSIDEREGELQQVSPHEIERRKKQVEHVLSAASARFARRTQ